ncbi:MaoC family dehydratase [Chloroflexota bacterium]
MSDKNIADYANLEPGYIISSASYTFLPTNVEAYLVATEDAGDLYRDTGLIPPMATAALSMGAISDSISFPDGAVHVSQQMEFCGEVKVGQSVVCTSKVISRRKRGPFNMLVLGIEVKNKDDIIVYDGKTSVLLPSEQGV